MDMLIIDRFEGEYAVCEKSEDGETKMVHIAKVMLPRNAREGDCLTGDGAGGWVIDGAATIRRRREIAERMNDLYH